MRAAVIALSLAMLVTGTINTVSTKYQVWLAAWIRPASRTHGNPGRCVSAT